MKTIANYALAALVAGGVAAPANAHVSVAVGIGGPGYYGGYYGGYGGYGYSYYRPCSFYRYRGWPAPRRCYRAYYGYYGPSVFIGSGFVFRNRDHFRSWGRGGWGGGHHGGNPMGGHSGHHH